ncbi:hypothetical protein HDV05_008070 [Chytridiales sp. JEL 0842]|nr:hypothetical protein HDV05_008070 [Chytridiales sp. JEL 0842]
MVKQVANVKEFQDIINSGSVVVDFFATWCGPCKVISPKFEEFSKQYTSATFIKVDVDEVPEAAEACGIRAMPTFQVYKDGKKVGEVVGADKNKLEAEIAKVTADLDIAHLQSLSTQEGFASGLSALVRPEAAQERCTSSESLTAGMKAFDCKELVVAQVEWAPFTIGKLSTCADLDSPLSSIRWNSEQLLKLEVQWAAHLGLSTVIFPSPVSEDVVNYAQVVNRLVGYFNYTKAFIRIAVSDDKPNSGWHQWSLIRSLTAFNSKLFVALEVGDNFPSDSVLSRWLAEPVKMLILQTSAFITNKKGFPVLSKRQQTFVQKLMDLNVQVIVSTPTADLSPGNLTAYRQYIEHLYRTKPEGDIVDKFAAGYHDYLQSPLQPLMDNLESATYEVFEKDPIKYREYENAIKLALTDKAKVKVKQTIVVMVVGAGRGPLVDCAIRASKASNVSVRLYAVEKNPNAIVTLRLKKQNVWGDTVTVIHSDMRSWTPPEKADILVSELLGSFGDNELSPECLDGAQKVLKDDGISIPCNYTAFISPISSSKLHSEVTSYNDLTHIETPYVVKFKAVQELAEPVALWTFDHPRRDLDQIWKEAPLTNVHNTRYASAVFEIPYDVVVHGIAGYFESVLYKDVMLSIHPKTHSPGMFSWFPLFFPIKEPIFLPANSSLEIHFWRQTDTRKVWYEWTCIPYLKEKDGGKKLLGASSGLHNINGRSYWIGL